MTSPMCIIINHTYTTTYSSLSFEYNSLYLVKV